MEKEKKDKTHEHRNLTKAEQLRLRRAGRGGGDRADWSSVDGKCVVAAIAAATKHGYAVTFGYTREGSAYTIRVLGDDTFETEYVRPSEDINRYLTALADDLESIL